MNTNFKKMLATTLILGASFLSTQTFAASHSKGTIKVGVLHSLSGTMAISETTLKDTMLMLIEQQTQPLCTRSA